jgi:hypothetical protein
MKRLLTFSALMFALMLVPGCGGDTHDSLAAESVDVMKKLVAALEGVKDEATARSAKPTLESLASKMKDIDQRQTKLGTPTDAEIKAMGDKYGKEMEALQPKLVAAMMRMQFDPQIAAVLQDIDMKMK